MMRLKNNSSSVEETDPEKIAAKKAEQEGRRKASALRVKKDLDELRREIKTVENNDTRLFTAEILLPLPTNTDNNNNDDDSITKFEIKLTTYKGYYTEAKYTFCFDCHPSPWSTPYPHDAPIVKLREKIYHPHISYDGHISLNILRPDWKPIFDISAIVYGLAYLLMEPCPNDGLMNHHAGELMRRDPEEFGRVVKSTLEGNSYDGQEFERLI